EIDREAVQPGSGQPARGRGDERGIEPSRKIAADGHIRAQPDLGGIQEERSQFLGDRGFAAVVKGGRVVRLRIVELPVRFDLRALWRGDQNMRGWKLEHVLECGARSQRKPKGEDLVE